MVGGLVKGVRVFDSSTDQILEIKSSNRKNYVYGFDTDPMSGSIAILDIFEQHGIPIEAALKDRGFSDRTKFRHLDILEIDSVADRLRDSNVIIGFSDYKYGYRRLKSFGISHIYFFDACSHYLPAVEESYLFDNEDRFDRLYHLFADDLSRRVCIGFLRAKVYRNFSDLYETRDRSGYFNELIDFDKPYHFVDCGAYTGDTVQMFTEHCKDYKKIYALEPDERLFKCLESISNMRDVELIKKGASNVDSIVRFNPTGFGSAHVGSQGECSIEVTYIDKILSDLLSSDTHHDIVIKMDIEGSEMLAVMGATETIKRFRPVMCICVYHRQEHLLDVSEYLLSLHGDYKLYLRNRNFVSCDTVLFAV